MEMAVEVLQVGPFKYKRIEVGTPVNWLYFC